MLTTVKSVTEDMAKVFKRFRSCSSSSDSVMDIYANYSTWTLSKFMTTFKPPPFKMVSGFGSKFSLFPSFGRVPVEYGFISSHRTKRSVRSLKEIRGYHDEQNNPSAAFNPPFPPPKLFWKNVLVSYQLVDSSNSFHGLLNSSL